MKIDLQYALLVLNNYNIKVRIKSGKVYALEYWTQFNKYGEDNIHESWRRIDNMTQEQFDNWIANL